MKDGTERRNSEDPRGGLSPDLLLSYNTLGSGLGLLSC